MTLLLSPRQLWTATLERVRNVNPYVFRFTDRAFDVLIVTCQVDQHSVN